MKKRPGFTLAELILAILIFSFMMVSLATIYSTSSRNIFQNYRANMIKTSTGVAMRAVQNNLSVATRLDVPLFGAGGDILAFATNVDQLSGCYPVGPGSAAWHYFCIGPDPSDPTLSDLFYHTAVIPAGTGCAAAAPSIWGGVYPVPPGQCGKSIVGQTVTIMMQAAAPNPVFFSRRPTETVMVKGVPVVTQGVAERDVVRIMLHAFWSASGRNFGKTQRDVDFTMDSAIKVNIPVW